MQDRHTQKELGIQEKNLAEKLQYCFEVLQKRFLSYSSSSLLSQTVHVASCWPATTTLEGGLRRDQREKEKGDRERKKPPREEKDQEHVAENCPLRTD